MALTSIPSTIFFQVLAQLTPIGASKGGAVARLLLDFQLASGSGVLQADGVHKSSRSLVGAATETISLHLLTDENGVVINPAEIVLFAVVAKGTNLGTIMLDDSPATPWTSFFASSAATDDGQLRLLPGGFIIAGTTADPAYAVNAGSRQFLVTNLDAVNTNKYELYILTRSV